jgi:heat shock protein HslJ
MTKPHRPLVATTAAVVLTAAIQPAAAAPVPLSALANAEYHGIYEQPVTLKEGRYEGEPFLADGASRPTVILIDRMVAVGDLDADGEQDAAVLLVENSGGSGSFVYLAAVSLAGGAARNLATTQLGDRVQVRNLSQDDGAILVDLVVAGEEDASALPATKIRKTFQVSDGALIERASETQDALSLADLEGTAWTLRTMNGTGGETQPEGAITASFQDARISGGAGCNRYVSGVEDQGRGAIAIGDISATQAACPEPLMELERAFLEHLAAVERFGFRFGDLVLSGTGGILVFSPGMD